MAEAQPRRVEKVPPGGQRYDLPAAAATVRVIANDRMSDRRQVHANLVSNVCWLGCGLPPIEPAANCKFCSANAAFTSEGLIPRLANLSGFNQMRIPKSSPTEKTSPTPGTRSNASFK
jgi:hypothetical protein